MCNFKDIREKDTEAGGAHLLIWSPESWCSSSCTETTWQSFKFTSLSPHSWNLVSNKGSKLCCSPQMNTSFKHLHAWAHFVLSSAPIYCINLQLGPWWNLILCLLWDHANPTSAVCVSVSAWAAIYTVTCPTVFPPRRFRTPPLLYGCVGWCCLLLSSWLMLPVILHMLKPISWQLKSQKLAMANDLSYSKHMNMQNVSNYVWVWVYLRFYSVAHSLIMIGNLSKTRCTKNVFF